MVWRSTRRWRNECASDFVAYNFGDREIISLVHCPELLTGIGFRGFIMDYCLVYFLGCYLDLTLLIYISGGV